MNQKNCKTDRFKCLFLYIRNGFTRPFSLPEVDMDFFFLFCVFACVLIKIVNVALLTTIS